MKSKIHSFEHRFCFWCLLNTSFFAIQNVDCLRPVFIRFIFDICHFFNICVNENDYNGIWLIRLKTGKSTKTDTTERILYSEKKHLFCSPLRRKTSVFRFCQLLTISLMPLVPRKKHCIFLYMSKTKQINDSLYTLLLYFD